MLFLAALLFLVDLLTGPSAMTVTEAPRAFLSPSSVPTSMATILWDFRLPAALMAALTGVALGVSGVVMQTILGNPLASPFTLGASSAAGFGAALALTGHALIPFAGFDVYVNAFVCTVLCSMLVYAMARYRSASSEVLVLTGIAMMFLFNSGMAMVQYLAAEEELQSIIFWLFGNLSRAGLPQASVLACVLLVCMPLCIFDAWRLSALCLGENNARSLGINVRMLRFRMVLVTSLLTAAAICFVGTIAFIGLVAPHIARLLVGEDRRYLLPGAALAGSALLSLAATLSELAVPTVVLPVGVVTSLIGTPFFMLLVVRFRRELL